MPRRPSTPRIVIAILFVLFGFAPLLSGARYFYLAAHSRGWRTTSGRVVEKELVKTSSPVTIQPVYQPRLRYQYEVDGVTRTSTQVFQVPRLMTEEEAQALDKRSGATIEVHYNPARPEESFLFPVEDGGGLGWRPLGIGVVLWGLAAFVLLRGMRA